MSRGIEQTTRRAVETGDYELVTHVEYSLVDGAFKVRLDPDAQALHNRKPWLTADQARQLAADLLAQADEADRHNDGSPDADEFRRGYDEQAAWLAGKSLYAAEQSLAQRQGTLSSHPYNRGGTQATADYIGRLRTQAEVQAFLDEQLSRDDMTLGEIAAEVVRIARGQEG